MFELSEKVAVVTGALGLLGRQHCEALAEAGARVVALDLNDDGAQCFASQLADSSNVETLGAGLDITSPAALEDLRDRVLDRFGRIDVLINNAAVDDKVKGNGQQSSRFEDYPLELFRQVLDVNVTGAFLCCQKLGAVMAERGSGSIINIASTYGVVAPQQAIYRQPDGSQTYFKSAAYPVSKGAVLQLTRFLAAYWGNSGVRVNTLSPGGVEVPGQADHFRANYAERTPLGRMARPTDYRGAVVFLASDASAYMTGANLVVDGGWTTW